MSWASIATQFALTVGASLAERLASALSARIKQEPEKANSVDIAIATKSHVSADREGKIASERAKARLEEKLRHCVYCGRLELQLDAYGYCLLCAEDRLRALQGARRLGDYGPGGK